MQNERAIVIKNPILRRIRNNLRLILRLDTYEKYKHLINERNIIVNSGSEEIILKNKQDEINHLNQILNHSICKCRVCSGYENDVVYTLKWDYWLCVSCYKDLQKYYHKKGESISIRFNILDSSFKL